MKDTAQDMVKETVKEGRVTTKKELMKTQGPRAY
jgi:hypothetical protein